MIRRLLLLLLLLLFPAVVVAFVVAVVAAVVSLAVALVNAIYKSLRDLPPLHADLTPVFMLRVYSAPAHRTHNLQESQNLVLPNAPSFPPAACCRR